MSNVWFNISITAGLLVSSILLGDTSAFRYTLTPSSVAVGERAYLEIRLQTSGTQDEDRIPEVNDEFLSNHKSLMLLQKDVNKDGNDIVWKYHITSYTAEEAMVPPIQVRYGANTFSTERLPLTITTTRGEADQEIRPEFDKLMMPINWKKLTIQAILVAISVYLFKRTLHFLKKVNWKKVDQHTRMVFTPKMKAREWLRGELEKLKTRTMSSGEDSEDFVDDLTALLRTYFTLQSAKFANAMTSEELALEFKFNEKLKPIEDLFRKCDHYRFGDQKMGSAKDLTLFGITQSQLTLCGN